MHGETNTNHKSEEFKRILSSSIFVAICWIVFIVMFLFVYFFQLFPSAVVLDSFYKTVTTTKDDGTEIDKDYSLGFRGFTYMGESNKILTNGSLVLVRAYDPKINPLYVDTPAAYYSETFDAATNKLASSTLVVRNIVKFVVSRDYSYATIDSTALDGSDPINGQLVRYGAIIGSLAEGQYSQIGFVGSVSQILAPSLAVSIVTLILIGFVLLVLPILLALRLRKHGYGMNNMHEQKRVFMPALGLVVSVIVFAVIFVGLYLPTFSKSSGLYYYNGETVKDVVTKGSFYKIDKFNKDANPLVAGAPFVYLVENKNEKGIVTSTTQQIKICKESYFHIGEQVNGKYQEAYMVVFYGDLDAPDADNYLQLKLSNIVGSITPQTMTIPYIGYAAYYLNINIFVTIITLVVFALLLILLPILFLRKRIIISKRISPFKEGLNKDVLSPEAGFIYQNLRQFLRDGPFQIRKGYDCDMVYMSNNKLFCKIIYENKCVCVLINKSFHKYDNRLDRRGFINIAHGADLDAAKDRIYLIYKQYFKK